MNALFSLGSRWLPLGLTQDKVRILFQSMKPAFGVFVNRNIDKVEQVGVVLRDERDRALLSFAESMTDQMRVEINSLNTEYPFLEGYVSEKRSRFFLGDPQTPLSGRLKSKQFLLISYSAWQYIIRNERSLLHTLPSFVIVKPKEDDH